MSKVVPLFREQPCLTDEEHALAAEVIADLGRYLENDQIVALAVCAVLRGDEIYLVPVSPSSDPFLLVGGLDDLKRQVHEDRDATFEWMDES